MTDQIKEFVMISQAIGNCPDYVQGGGGNTSVKLDEQWMAVKASGFKLNQVATQTGFVIVNYKKIISYYETVDLTSNIDYEKTSIDYIKNTVMDNEAINNLRPSVEAGFHAVLKKYVIHSHSVYSNILCCSDNSKKLIEKIFSPVHYPYVWIPYIKPGFSLAYKIMQEKTHYFKKNKQFPEIIFMENHGLIITTDEADKCLELHQQVNDVIKSYYGIMDAYPEYTLKKIDENCFLSQTPFNYEFIKKHPLNDNFFNDYTIYPDQQVYLNDCLSFSGNNKLNIDIEQNEIIYKTGYQDAVNMEETLLAYFYVLDKIYALELCVKSMPAAETEYIKNWDAEKFRRQVSTE